MDTRPLSPHLGLEIRDVDARAVDPETATELAALLLRHGILLLRDQDIDTADQVRFSHHLGELERFPVNPDDPNDEFVFRVSNDRRRGYKGVGLYWHTDGYFHERPTAVSILRAVVVPSRGGDTGFANMGRAFATRPDDVREHVRGLVGISRPAPGSTRSAGLFGGASATGVRHPLVRPHPLTGEPVLYMNLGNMIGFDGLDRQESRALLDRLEQHVEHGDFAYRHRWRPGDMILWDNAGVAHKASVPPTSELRLMERTTIVGDEYFESTFWAAAADRATSLA
jgi:taurine dioxygenase